MCASIDGQEEFFTVDLFVELVLRQVGGQHRQLTESQQRLLLHKVACLHVGLAVERPVGLQKHKMPRQPRHHTKSHIKQLFLVTVSRKEAVKCVCVCV